METTQAIPQTSAKRVALDVKGLAAFTTLSGEPRRFRKEVLRVGKWIHPATGETLDFTRGFLGRLVSSTARWIELGNKVWFPAGHSSDPRDNLGFWSSFALEGDRIVGVLEVQDEDVASKVGKTIQDVSASIWWNARASSGETFEAVMEHVCGTPCPVIPGQTNFVRLAREANVTDTEPKTGLAQDGGLDLTAAIKLLLGLPQDAQDAAVIEAVRALCFDEDEDDDCDAAEDSVEAQLVGDGSAPAISPAPAALATLERRVEELTRENKRIRSRVAKEKVEFARRRSIELGIPLDDDIRKEALSLLEQGDEHSEKLGNQLLDLALRPVALAGKALPNPATREDDKAELDRHAALERAYVSQGLSVEKDQRGRIVRVSRPEPKKK